MHCDVFGMPAEWKVERLDQSFWSPVSTSAVLTVDRFDPRRPIPNLGASRSSAAGTVHALPRPLGGQPGGNSVGERHIEFGVACAHPRLDGDVGVRRLRGVEVDAPDDVTRDRLEDGEREPGASLEVGGMAAQVVEVPVERHPLRRRPVAVGEARGRPNVIDARRPRCVVGLVVLWAERLQPESVADEGRRRLEVGRDERQIGHLADASLPRVSRIFTVSVASVYPHYVAKVEKKGRTNDELDQVIRWLTGFDEAELRRHLAEETTFEKFFAAARLNPNASLITGTVCGVRVQDVEDPLMQKIRYLDKLVDELAKGKAMPRILRGELDSAAAD